ncbi:tRNA uridine-5-carboxymethylaminomethyl(34) synthesis enzyme MnmG [Sphingomonas sp.]|uniref:tRNA uridine-5-carboxymethylaminomethyl(34) synthesis enzyme MnmG n=1 Tax=Sphingomonas sp. TaxID=28214 RepID=UPI003B3ADB00
MSQYQVIVVGGGHAGCEAAAAAARIGASVALVTDRIDTIGAMSCNPAIGGVGKGHLVREVDVFDGLIGRAADAAAIHYRMLNRSKGTAVQGPRVQADRKHFARAIQQAVAAQQGFTVVQGHAHRLLLRSEYVSGLELADGTILTASAVILATGTFLGGRLYCGADATEGGRVGESAATILAQQLRALDLPMARLKTGTPPRLDGRTIDWARLERQPSDGDPWTMSPLGRRTLPQLACAIARTNQQTHDIIRAGLDRSPIFSGAIEGRGPRYCPSIEDKVVRFGDRDGHQIFLEPEGLGTTLVYPNGISTSLPRDVQRDLVRSVAGLGSVEIVTPGYAVEYDHVDPRALDASLGLRAIPGLYCAGQINGTTGYEEAAAQGLVAGLNAAAQTLGRSPILFDRTQSYIGVMVDDLVLQGVSEPYRMLTGRAEFRLALRADNAATRLGGLALASEAVGEARKVWIADHLAQHTRLSQAVSRPLPPVRREGAAISTADLVRQRAMTTVEIRSLIDPEADGVSDTLLAELADDCRYAPYIDRQRAEVARLEQEGQISLSPIHAYRDIGGLSKEMIEKLDRARPATLADAARIRGITPAALSAILVAIRRRAA